MNRYLGLYLLITSNVFLMVIGRCLNWCSRRGICTSPDDIGVCDCKVGYTNEDCSAKLCPKAYDVLTAAQNPNRRSVRMLTGATSGVLSGSFSFHFMGSEVSIPSGVDTASCSTYLGRLLTVDKVSCQVEILDKAIGSQSIVIELESYPEIPYENNIFTHSGNPPLSFFKCETTLIERELAEDPYCDIEDIYAADDLPLYKECGNHGSCNTVDGTCVCNLGFHGPSCFDTTDNRDIQLHSHDGPFFTGNILRVAAQREESADFNIFSAHIVPTGAVGIKHSDYKYTNSTVVTAITGDRKLLHNGAFHVSGFTVLSVPHGDIKDVVTLTYGDFRSSSKESNEPLSTTTNHIKAISYGKAVWSVDLKGGMHANSLSIANDSILLEPGLLTTHDLKVLGSLDILGAVNLEDSLTIGSEFALTPGGMTVDVNKHTGTLFELRSRQPGFNGSLLEIHANGMESSMIKTVVDGQTTFDLSSRGNMQLTGVRLSSGGVVVEAGGLTVQAGGIIVKGGLTVETGGLNIKSNEFKAGKLTLESSSLESNTLRSVNTNKHFVGSIMELVSSSDENNNFAFVNATTSSGNRIFSVSGNGELLTAGSISSKGLRVDGHAAVNGGASFKMTSVSAGDTIILPVTSTFIVIESDSINKTNQLVFPLRNEKTLPGQFMIVLNQDTEPTSNPVIPPGSGIVFIYDGSKWIDIQALSVPAQHLRDVRTFTAANDISIGNITMQVGSLGLMNAYVSGLPFIGNNGVLSTTNKLTYTKNILSVLSLKVSKILSDIDFRGNFARNVFIEDSFLRNVTIISANIKFASGRGLAYFDDGSNLVNSKNIDIDSNGNLVFTNPHPDFKDHILLKLNENGTLVPAVGLFHVGGTLITKAISGHALTGDIHAGGHFIYGVNIEAAQIKTTTLNVADHIAIASLASAKDLRLVVADTKGKLIVDGFQSHPSIEKLLIDDLIVGNNLDLNGKTISNGKLINIDLGELQNLKAKALTLRGLIGSGDSDQAAVLSVGPTGELLRMAGVYSNQYEVLTATGGFATNGGVTAESVAVTGGCTVNGTMNIKTLKAGLVSSTADGKLVTVSDNVSIQLPIIVSKEISTDSLKVKELKFIHGSSSGINLLAFNPDGVVSSADGISIPSLAVEKLTASECTIIADTKTYNIEVSGNVKFSGLTEAKGDDFLTITSEGLVQKMKKSELEFPSPVDSSGNILLASITPIDKTIKITNAVLENPLIIDGIVNAKDFSVSDTFSVKAQANFMQEVFIDQTLTVSGSVIGSGPYMDSSDARFKRDVRPLGSVLDKVTSLQGKTYIYDKEKFPSKNFPTTRQIGWLADEVETIFPELVGSDGEGYRSVSYSHASVLIAEALRELKEESRKEMDFLRKRIEVLESRCPLL